ncbi:MAG: hypothetical protein WD271_06655 [Acidimicrobiia bacterium]
MPSWEGRMRRHAGIAIAALVASVGLMVASAPMASAKTVDVDEWAEGFCNAVEDWQTTALKAHDLVDNVIENGVSSSSKAKSAQKKIVDALAAASKKSTSTSKAVKDLGAPAVANGSKISTTIATAIGDTAEAFSDAKDAVAKASTDPKKFRAKVKTVSAEVDSDLAKAGEDISDIDTLDKGGELDDAFNAEPACSFLTDS